MATCDLSGDAWLGAYGTRGDCPMILSTNSSCEPGCAAGAAPTGPVTCADDAEPSLSPATWCEFAEPTCNLANLTGLPPGALVIAPGAALEGLSLPLGGDCRDDVLASNWTCRPACAPGYSLYGDIACTAGVLEVRARCDLTPLACQAGFEQVGTSCQPCPGAMYKSGEGPGPCSSCPDGSDPNWGGLTSAAGCICNSTTYAQRNSSSNALTSCGICPNASKVFDQVGSWHVNHCKCDPGYLREPPDENAVLVECRLPRTCDLRQWLQRMNVTNQGDVSLLLGTCARYLNSSTHSLPHEDECRLYCPSGTSPQQQADFFKAVNPALLCEDGVVMSEITPDTWCSETSFEIPPLVFLATVTLASVVAFFRMELRQHRFERQCTEALQLRQFSSSRLSTGVQSMGVSPSKFKVA